MAHHFRWEDPKGSTGSKVWRKVQQNMSQLFKEFEHMQRMEPRAGQPPIQPKR